MLAPGLVLHDPLRELRRDGLRLPLTPTEYALLCHLARHRGRIVPDEELVSAAWGAGAAVSPQMLYAHISALRGKLGRRARIARRYAQGYHLEPGSGGAARPGRPR